MMSRNLQEVPEPILCDCWRLLQLLKNKPGFSGAIWIWIIIGIDLLLFRGAGSVWAWPIGGAGAARSCGAGNTVLAGWQTTGTALLARDHVLVWHGFFCIPSQTNNLFYPLNSGLEQLLLVAVNLISYITWFQAVLWSLFALRGGVAGYSG